jgi:hypothetical protein
MGQPEPEAGAHINALRRLFIIVRGDPGLYEFIKRRWLGDERVEVIVNRRRAERRRRNVRPDIDRRRWDRRLDHRDQEVALRSSGWIEVPGPHVQPSSPGRPSKADADQESPESGEPDPRHRIEREVLFEPTAE